MNNRREIPVLKLFVTIIDRDKVKKLSTLLNESHIHFHYVLLAEGTAGSEILDSLGLGSDDKAVVFCHVPAFYIEFLMDKISSKFKLRGAGSGIAFTLTLSCITNPKYYLLSEMLDEETMKEIMCQKEKDVRKMTADAKYDLILAIINQGYSEELMTAARSAGATGGTVINARRINSEEAMNVFGISVLPKKEIVAILTSQDDRHEIMQAINRECGIKTEAKAIIMSLPVDHVAGI